MQPGVNAMYEALCMSFKKSKQYGLKQSPLNEVTFLGVVYVIQKK